MIGHRISDVIANGDQCDWRFDDDMTRSSMKPSHWFETLYCRAVDQIYRQLTQKVPDDERLRLCKIISHRGVFDNIDVFENTLAAFDNALALGIWGIELDIRWTRDFVPVVCHDSDTRRVFRTDIHINETGYSRLAAQLPQIPSLEHVVQRYGKHLHLMIELKAGTFTDPWLQSQILQELLAGITPERDFHLISMSPGLFHGIQFLPSTTFLPIAQLNVGRCSHLVKQHHYGGLLGHYSLIRKSEIFRHQRAGRQIGTGFVNSIGCLFRELNRKVEWIFTDRAAILQAERLSFLNRVDHRGVEHENQ